MIRKSATTLCFLFMSIFLFSQKKTLLKLEIPVGMMAESSFIPTGQKLNVMYPTLYIPLHKHVDIGAGYTNQKLNYYIGELDQTDNNYKYYQGNIKYKVTSLYLKINLSASQKRVNPFFSYVLSFSKGTYTGPKRDSTSDFYQDNGNGFYGGPYGTGDDFTYGMRMTSQEEGELKKSLDKSQMSHGVQIGLDYKIMPFLNLFIKMSSFNVVGYGSRYPKEKPFSFRYEADAKQYSVSPMEYYMFGIILKIDGGKKSLIK